MPWGGMAAIPGAIQATEEEKGIVEKFLHNYNKFECLCLTKKKGIVHEVSSLNACVWQR